MYIVHFCFWSFILISHIYKSAYERTAYPARNPAALKASVAHKLQNLLVHKSSKGFGDFFKPVPHVRSSLDLLYIRHKYAVRTKVTQHEFSTNVA